MGIVLQGNRTGEGPQVGGVVRRGVVAELDEQPTGQVVKQHGIIEALPARGQVGARLVHGG